MNNQAEAELCVNTVLLLCSRNFYRIRFAEEFFNSMVPCQGMPWQANSAGLGLDPNNKGPVSTLVLDRDESLYIRALPVTRLFKNRPRAST